MGATLSFPVEALGHEVRPVILLERPACAHVDTRAVLRVKICPVLLLKVFLETVQSSDSSETKPRELRVD
jgi:hypothetical protein